MPPLQPSQTWAQLVLDRDEALRDRLLAVPDVIEKMRAFKAPLHPADGLSGSARTLAEGLLLLGPGHCRGGFEALLPTLDWALEGMDPARPGRVPTTLGVLGLVLIAQGTGALGEAARDREVDSWIDGLKTRPIVPDGASRLQAAWLSAALGRDAAARELLDSAAASIGQEQAWAIYSAALCGRLHDAVASGTDLQAIEGDWYGFLRAFPDMLKAGAANWILVHAVARMVFGRLGQVPLDELAAHTHKQVMQAVAG
jgi:hypothetical protein